MNQLAQDTIIELAALLKKSGLTYIMEKKELFLDNDITENELLNISLSSYISAMYNVAMIIVDGNTEAVEAIKKLFEKIEDLTTM